MAKHRPKHHHRTRCRSLARLAFPINALMLMTLMLHFGPASAIRASLPHAPQTIDARDARDNYQSNYEDGPAVSTGYTLSQNYFDMAPSYVGSSSLDDNAPTYGSAGSGGAPRFENLQQFPSTGLMPTTVTAAGQHFVDMEKGDELGESLATRHTNSIQAMPQIGGMRATGRYTMPPGKIDYEINAANYDAGTETASGSNEPGAGTGADIMQSNDAYNVATLHDLAHSQQQLANRQQQHRKPHIHPHYLRHSEHQLEFAAPSPGAPDIRSEFAEFKSYKNIDATDTPTPIETKYQQLNTDAQNRQQKHQQHQKQQDYLHNFEMLQQYANYRQKPYTSGNLLRRGVLDKAKPAEHARTFVSLEPTQLTHGYRIMYNQKLQQQQLQTLKGKFYQQQLHRHSRDDFRDDSYAEDPIRSQSQHYYAHTPVSNDLTDSYGRSLHYTHDPPSSHLPPISHVVHHTPASTAAISGIPLSRHVEIIKHVPVPQTQRELVPYNHTVPIEIPDPLITTIQKPIPIKVPIPRTVAIPQLQLVKIPIERIKPMPVERPIPYIVEKRVPYKVEKQVAKPVFVPYPLRVPVVNTVVHKLPRHGHSLKYAHNLQSLLGYHQHQHLSPKNSLFSQFSRKSDRFG